MFDEIVDELVLEELGYERARFRAMGILARFADRSWIVVSDNEENDEGD